MTNGLYAVIGISTAVDSLVVMVVVDKWKMMSDALMGKLHGKKEGLVMVTATGRVVGGILPMDFLKSQRLLIKKSRLWV